MNEKTASSNTAKIINCLILLLIIIPNIAVFKVIDHPFN